MEARTTRLPSLRQTIRWTTTSSRASAFLDLPLRTLSVRCATTSVWVLLSSMSSFGIGRISRLVSETFTLRIKPFANPCGEAFGGMRFLKGSQDQDIDDVHYQGMHLSLSLSSSLSFLIIAYRNEEIQRSTAMVVPYPVLDISRRRHWMQRMLFLDIFT